MLKIPLLLRLLYPLVHDAEGEASERSTTASVKDGVGTTEPSEGIGRAAGFHFVFIRCSTHILLLAITLPTKINEDDIDLLSFSRFETEMASIFRYR